MADARDRHVWGNTEAYDAYMGRWSRPLADRFVAWLAPAPGLSWIDVGCGTGALTQAILAAAEPQSIAAIDPSAEFLASARREISDNRANFAAGSAEALPRAGDSADAVVVGLALNLVPEPVVGLTEMIRVARPGGTVAGYVWDYGGQMQLMRAFWDAAAAFDPETWRFDQAARYPFCQPEPLRAFCEAAGLRDVQVDAIDVPMLFRDFDDFWQPHLLPGPAPAQRYVATLEDPAREQLRQQLLSTLPINADGTLPLVARAWAFRGTA